MRRSQVGEMRDLTVLVDRALAARPPVQPAAPDPRAPQRTPPVRGSAGNDAGQSRKRRVRSRRVYFRDDVMRWSSSVVGGTTETATECAGWGVPQPDVRSRTGWSVRLGL